MGRVRVKVCGITHLEDARMVGRLGVDAVGFNFCSASPRCVTPSAAREMARAVPTFVARVGVFRNHPGPEVDRIAREAGLDRLQLHGDEDPDYCAARSLPVIKVLRIGPGWDPASAESFRDWPLLVDAWDAHQAGGTGLRSDWPAARALVLAGFEVILAGGLGPDSVVEAVRQVRPAGIDLNSALESTLGRKDMARLKRVLELLAADTPPDPEDHR